MLEHMAPACFIDMEVNRLLANRTLGQERAEPPSTQKFYKLQNPYKLVRHRQRLNFRRILDDSYIRIKIMTCPKWRQLRPYKLALSFRDLRRAPSRGRQPKLLRKDEARGIAVNFAKLPALLC
jgi:hypothetical protein